jgi:DNA modification methylase
VSQAYQDFLRSKMVTAQDSGVAVSLDDLNPKLFPHQRALAAWAIRGGNRAIFASFGLGKTVIQIQILETLVHDGFEPEANSGLIVCPLGVKGEFVRDAKTFFNLDFQYVRTNAELADCREQGKQFFLTNYERIRDGALDPNHFKVVSLDEASVLRGFGGTKTFREFMRLFEQNPNIKHKFVATATPSPNDYIELLAYAAFLDVMDVGQAKTRFFKRDSTKADVLTLHPHKEREFWLWVSTWAIFLQKPSDLGPEFSDEGYDLPGLDVHWHELPSDHATAIPERGGQGRLLRNTAIGVTHAAREKRDSLEARIECATVLINGVAANRAEHRSNLGTDDPSPKCLLDDAKRSLKSDREARGDDVSKRHWLLWHDLEDERRAIEKAFPSAFTVYGSQDLEKREQLVAEFSEGKIRILGAKPVLCGSGCNFQRHCHSAIFLGIGFKFNDFYQAIHRIHRFLQKRRVQLHLIYTEAEREVRRVLEEKWAKHNELVAQMTAIIRQYGLAANALNSEMQRTFGVERQEVKGENFTLVRNDAIVETAEMPANSVHLILTSVPFSTQYEYCPSYNDFGHNDDNKKFFEQMDYLTPQLLRILQPGRICAIHVKDRIVPGGMTGLGFQTAYPFHADCIYHYQKHGFAYLGMKTIVTDVVRENNQTYRLGWTEQCKDGSRMGVGMPEYLLLFRKPPTDASKGYADLPVLKNKPNCVDDDGFIMPTDFPGYSRSRWQIDAHAFSRSNGNRLLSPEDFQNVPHERIFKLFRAWSQTHVYDFEQHVKLGESLETCRECGHIHVLPTGYCKCGCKGAGRLPVTFMLLQPQSWHTDVWTDITRMLSLNSAQSAAGREMHLCPMQFDLADRAINQYTMEGETVFDPFAGIGTVPLRALKLKRKGYGVELAEGYFRDAVYYCAAAELEADSPTLFDLTEAEATA